MGSIMNGNRKGPHIQRGGASDLHFGSGGRRYRATGTRIAHTRPQRTRPPRKKLPGKALAALAAVLAVVILAGVWFVAWRDVTVTVNGEELSVRIGTPLETFLADNDHFGTTPGRLMSVGGNVLDEQGGNPCTVTRDDEELTADEVAAATIGGGEVYTVSNGTDALEPYTEEEVTIAPGVQKERGGAVQYVKQWGQAGSKTVLHGERSGETADAEGAVPATDMIIGSINLKPEGGPYVALTFDDGPSKYTPDILAVLADRGVHATFFCLGNQVASNPAGAQAVVDGGHEIASHTQSHANLPTLERDSLRSEISTAFDNIEQATGTRTQMMRAPYGAFTEQEWARAGDIVGCNVLWNIDTSDWERPGAQAIADAVLNNVHNGSIVLMHDGGGNREQTVEALPMIIDGLHDQGYTIVTVGELIELDGRIPQAVVDNEVSMPDDAVLPA